MSPPPILDEEREALAAEYALGVLAGDDFARARALYSAEAGFRAEVGRWLGRLAPLLDEVEPVAPPEQAWSAIEGRLSALDAREAVPAQTTNVVQLRRRVSVWQGLAGASSAIAAGLALVLITRPPTQPAPGPAPTQVAQAPSLVAVLGDEQRPAAVLASFDPVDGRLILAASDESAPAGRARELWVIPADGTPRSLGLLAAQATSRIDVPAALSRQLREGVTLAISIEPRGGSPTGLPTGPVVASGKLEAA